MLVRNGITREYYSYENLYEIKRILQFDCLCLYKIDENAKWIEYQIDRNLCIRLQDLFQQIKQDLIRIHLGQLLVLVQKILEKVIYLEQHQIKHDFIDMNRIWIKLFEKQSQYPNVFYQNLLYSIHFTGYQCPFYESQNNNKKDLSIKIKEIIKELLIDCFPMIQLGLPFGLFSSVQEKKQKNYDSTIANIINVIQMDNSSTKEIIKQVISLISTCKYNPNDQTIDIDDKKSDKAGSVRHKQVIEMYNLHKKVYDYGINKNSQLAAESIVNQLIPKFLQIINPSIKLNVNLDSYELLYDQYFKTQQEKNSQFLLYLKKEFENLYYNKLLDSQQRNEFEFNYDQKQKMKQDIIEATLNCQSLQYFQNTFWLEVQNQDFFLMKKIQAKTAMIKIQEERLELEILNDIIKLEESIF